MIITEHFVMINFPKTGSTFVRSALKNIHEKTNFGEKVLYQLGLRKKPFYQNLWLPNIRVHSNRYGKKDEHGIYKQIPKEHLNKDILSVKRNIFERYVSGFEYKDWQKNLTDNINDIRLDFPNFPHLSFEEYVNYSMIYNPHKKNPDFKLKVDIGPLTTSFIIFYFKDPFKILNELNDNYLNSDAFLDDMAPIKFLNQVNLNQDLYNILKNYGYPENKIEFIKKAKKINRSTPDGKSWTEYFSKDLLEIVKYKERFLYRIFNDYEV